LNRTRIAAAVVVVCLVIAVGICLVQLNLAHAPGATGKSCVENEWEDVQVSSVQAQDIRQFRNSRSLVIGMGFACYLTDDSEVVCWGAAAQRWTGDRAPRRVPQLAGATALYSGPYDVCALVPERGIVCMSSGPMNPSRAFERVDDIEDLAIGYRHICMLASGRVSCWGDNRVGQLGRSLDSRPPNNGWVDLPQQVVSLASAGDQTCAVLAEGGVVCWGGGISGDPDAYKIIPAPRNVHDAVAIRMSSSMACVLSRTGAIHCWEPTLSWGLQGGRIVDLVAAHGDMSDATWLAVGHRLVCGFRNPDAVFCWGENLFGQMGCVGPIIHRPTRIAPTIAIVDFAVGVGGNICIRGTERGMHTGDTVLCAGNQASGIAGPDDRSTSMYWHTIVSPSATPADRRD